MIPTTQMLKEIAQLIAGISMASPINFASDMAKLHLVKGAFTPGPDTTLADLTLVSTNGLVSKILAIGAQVIGVDSLSGENRVGIIPPEGGWRWVASTAPSEAINVTGVALISNDGATLYGTMKLPEIVTIDASGQEINVADISFRFGPTSFR